MNAAKTYATQLANDLVKINLTDFFTSIHSQFYPDQDISFMEYFLDITEHRGEFYIPHSKLIEFGIMTSERSNDALVKFERLQMVEGQDYRLRDVSQQLESGTKHSKEYHLTPQAFKKCLMRAQRRADQPIDPVIYVDYYLLLEEVFKLYTDYERLYSQKLLSIKDDKIDKLQLTVGDLRQRMDDLLGYARTTTETLDEVRDDLTETKAIARRTETYAKQTYNFMNSFLGLYIETGTSNSLFKNILARHEEVHGTPIENRWFPGVLKMKLLAFVGFYSDDTMYVYSIARNLGNSYFTRLRELYSKHRDMTMLQVRVISLIGCDVNEESTLIKSGNFYDGAFKKSQKRIEIKSQHDFTYSEARKIFNDGATRARAHRFHNYQAVIDNHLQQDDIDNRSKLAIASINKYDLDFHTDVRGYLIQFALSKVVRHATNDGFVFNGHCDRSRTIRNDLVDDDGTYAMMNKREYALANIYRILCDHDVVQHIRDLKDDGLVSDDDLAAL